MNKFKLLVALLAALNLMAPAARAAGDWAWPVRGDVITQYRNGSDAYAAGQHRGIDIAARTGEPVVATAGGVVTFAGVAGSSGLTVAVRTVDGRFDTSYLHLSAAAVREGDAVATGQRLGAVGMSGQRSADAPHLHFGVREAGSRHAYRDPLTLLAPPPRDRPAPDPRPAPAPVAVPAPVAPAPASAPMPALTALPALNQEASAAIVAHRSAAPAPAPARAAHGATVRQPAQVLVARSGVAPSHRASDGAARPPAKRAEASPARVGAQGTGPRSVQPEPRVASRTAAVAAKRDHGIDLGWLVACAGLVGAAAALGRSGKRGAARPRLSVGIARLTGSHGR